MFFVILRFTFVDSNFLLLEFTSKKNCERIGFRRQSYYQKKKKSRLKTLNLRKMKHYCMQKIKIDKNSIYSFSM